MGLKIFLLTVPRRTLFVEHLCCVCVSCVRRTSFVEHLCCVCVSCVSHAFASIHCCLVVTCWERADILALVGYVYCIFVTFLCGILDQVWYLIVSIPDLCRLSYFYCLNFKVSTFFLISNIFFINIGVFSNSDISNIEHVVNALALFWYRVCFSMAISS